ncbi:MAG TPA: hypothetical protein VGC11_11570 [Acidimicrobiia bacterium]|jgi:ABC-2 type transport system permease protein
MTDGGVIFDLGYKPHDGPRLGAPGAFRATVKDGIRRVLGLRRKARKKVLPFLLLGIALIPAVVVVGAAFLLADFDPESGTLFGGHSEFFGWVGTLVLIFAAFSAPELLVPDRVEGVLAVYSSRPIRARSYLLARATALAIVMTAYLLIPQLLMYVGFSVLGEDGLLSELVGRGDELLKIVGVTLAYIVAFGAPALLVAVFARRTATATGTYLAVMLVVPGIVTGLLEGRVAGARFAALLTLSQHPDAIRDWVYDTSTPTLNLVRAGWDPWVSLAAIAIVALATGFIGIRRYRSEL